MGHEPQILPDVTIFFQVGLFILSYLALRFLVFEPYLRLIHLRESKTVGLKRQAVEAREKAALIKSECEAFLAEERKTVAAWVEGERRSIGEKEKGIIQAARDRAAQELQAARKKTEDELKEAQRALSPLTVEFSSAIASKLLGYGVKVSPKATDTGKVAETETVLS